MKTLCENRHGRMEGARGMKTMCENEHGRMGGASAMKTLCENRHGRKGYHLGVQDMTCELEPCWLCA